MELVKCQWNKTMNKSQAYMSVVYGLKKINKSGKRQKEVLKPVKCL